MKWKRERSTILAITLIGLLIAISAGSALASDVKHLDKKEAIEILAAKGYKDIVIAVIVEKGVKAVVMGIAKKGGKSKKIEDVFSYDREIGWLDYESNWDPKQNRWMIILYTKKGKKIITH